MSLTELGCIVPICPDTKVAGYLWCHFSTITTVWVAFNGPSTCEFTKSRVGGLDMRSQQPALRARPLPPYQSQPRRWTAGDNFPPDPGRGREAKNGRFRGLRLFPKLSTWKGFWRVSSMFLQDVRKEERLNIKMEVWQAGFPELNALLVVFWKKKKRILLWKCHTPKRFL